MILDDVEALSKLSLAKLLKNLQIILLSWNKNFKL